MPQPADTTDSEDTSYLLLSVDSSTLPVPTQNVVVMNSYSTRDACLSNPAYPDEQLLYGIGACQSAGSSDNATDDRATSPLLWLKFSCLSADSAQIFYYSDAACTVVSTLVPEPAPMSVYKVWGDDVSAACDMKAHTNTTDMVIDKFMRITCDVVPTTPPTFSPTYLRGAPTPVPTTMPSAKPSTAPVGLDCWMKVCREAHVRVRVGVCRQAHVNFSMRVKGRFSGMIDYNSTHTKI